MECRMWQSNIAILQIYETISPEGDQEKGADLNNFVNESIKWKTKQTDH